MVAPEHQGNFIENQKYTHRKKNIRKITKISVKMKIRNKKKFSKNFMGGGGGWVAIFRGSNFPGGGGSGQFCGEQLSVGQFPWEAIF